MVLGLGGFEGVLLLSFLIVAKRNLVSSRTGSGDSPQQALNFLRPQVPKLPLGSHHVCCAARWQQKPSL